MVQHRTWSACCPGQQAHIEPRLGPLTCVVLAQEARVPLNEFEFPAAKLAKVQSQLEHLVGKNYYLHQSARDAYRG